MRETFLHFASLMARIPWGTFIIAKTMQAQKGFYKY
jgi:hypothetical protein